MFGYFFCRVYYNYREQKEVTEMKVGLNEALQNYLQDKGHKHLVLKAKICHSWAGSYKDITASYAEGNEQWLVEEGYVAGETELGKIYYRPQDVRFGDKPEIHLVEFFRSKRIAFKDISVAS